MLARPEIGTVEHIALWLASKPRHEEFYWPVSRQCAVGQYIREHGITDATHPDLVTRHVWIGTLDKLNDAARDVAYFAGFLGTFGALHDYWLAEVIKGGQG